jgi:Ca2+-binding EF-hand superfamily protein
LAAPGADGSTARKALFQAIDDDGDGTVSMLEAITAIATVWADFDNLSACMMAYEAADRDGSGGLSVQETRLFFQ